MSKIVAICASPRKKNTYFMIKTMLDSAGGKSEIILLNDLRLNHCLDCDGCQKNPFKCRQKDGVHELHAKLEKASAIILASPTYFDNVSGLMKNFMDRCLPLYFSKILKNKRVVIASVGSEGYSSIKNSIQAMERFSKLMGLKVIGKIYATASNPKAKEKTLLKMGKKMAA